jgi:hypothetical protein
MTQKNERLPHAQAKIYPDLVHYWSRDGWSGVSYQSEQADDRAVWSAITRLCMRHVRLAPPLDSRLDDTYIVNVQ